jgi:putative ABC transport system ATP-binding protein
VSIARALACRSDLILADEPTGELDTTTTRQILSLFQHLVKKRGFTVLLATHDPNIDEYADIIFTIDEGYRCSQNQVLDELSSAYIDLIFFLRPISRIRSF